MRNEINIMQVMRVPPLGKLTVEVNKQRYQNLVDVKDANVKRALLAAIGELVSFAGGYEKLEEAGLAPPRKNPAAEQPEPSLQAQQEAFLAALENQTNALRKVTGPLEPTVLREIRPVPQPAAEPVEPNTNIVAQIDAILQKYVTADPSLAKRSIHLEQEPAGGLRILVDGTYYDRPAAIKESKIQIYIKKALKEWESS